MVYRLTADLVLMAHLAFILFVLFGGFLVVRHHWLAWLHIPAVAWGALLEFMGLLCPLTPLENHLRRISGQGDYEGGFIEHYFLPILYPAQLTREAQIVLGAVVILVNLAIYGWVASSLVRVEKKRK